MNIGIDIDDTICNTYEVFLPYFKKFMEEELKREYQFDLEDKTDYYKLQKRFGLTDDEDFKQKVSKLVRWHMQPLFYDKNLPFFQPQDMINDVEYKEVALLSLCDRLGRGNLDEDKIKDEKERIEKFKEYFEKN